MTLEKAKERFGMVFVWGDRAKIEDFRAALADLVEAIRAEEWESAARRLEENAKGWPANSTVRGVLFAMAHRFREEPKFGSGLPAIRGEPT